MDDVIDLDALVPPPRTIKLGEENIKVEPPKTVDLIRLGSLSQKLSDVSSFTDYELEEAVNNLTQQIYKCIPSLQDKPLNLAQLQTLVDILNDMGTPPEVKALVERGIEAASPKALA